MIKIEDIIWPTLENDLFAVALPTKNVSFSKNMGFLKTFFYVHDFWPVLLTKKTHIKIKMC